jgi:ABC-type glycerol-3-phosphate transport system permease component
MSSVNRGIMSDIEWRSPRGRLIVGILFTALVIVSLIVLFPFFFSFTAGLKDSTEIYKPGLNLWTDVVHWENYIEARDFPVNLHMAGNFIAMVPPMIIAFFVQRYMKGGLTF